MSASSRPMNCAGSAITATRRSTRSTSQDSLKRIEEFFARLHKAGAAPLSAGGDHLVTLPILRAIARERPVGLMHFDAHSDTNDSYFGGEKYTHGTPFRRAIEEGLIDPKRTIQIGIRGSIYSADEKDWAESAGIRIVHIEEFFRLGPDAVVAEARRVVGDGPVYVSFDVDGLDPVYAPGTGTPGDRRVFDRRGAAHDPRPRRSRPGRRRCRRGRAAFRPSGNTALVGATMMFEILCVLAPAVHRRRNRLRRL